MARKVIFNMSNTLVATINKINQMSDWLGDLDDLNKSSYQLPKASYLGGFEDNEYTENGGLADQSAVAAAEWLHSELEKARVTLFGRENLDSGDSVDNSEFANLSFEKVLVVDSAVFRRFQINSLFIPVDSDLSPTSTTIVQEGLDSNFWTPSYQGGPVFNTGITIDSGYIRNFSGIHLDIGRWMVSDSSFRTFFNDSTDSIGSFVPVFDFGFTVRDSAYIGVVHGPRNLFPFPRPRKPGFPNGYTFDSSTININTPLSFDSGKSTITLLAPDSTDSSQNWTLDYDSANFKKILVDSATFDTWCVESDGDNLYVPSPLHVKRFVFDVDSSFDSATPPILLPGGFDSSYRADFHGRLDSGFEHTSPFTIYESDGANIHFGALMISQYDSDNRL